MIDDRPREPELIVGLPAIAAAARVTEAEVERLADQGLLPVQKFGAAPTICATPSAIRRWRAGRTVRA